jgi:glycosyltransferase involved in cell wall biosynthesis
MEEVVRFFGLIPKEEVVKWYNVATASFVTFKNLPVLHTSSPNKMFDSFAAGVPIIQNTTGWIKDLIDNECCGINVSPEDAKGMGSAVDLLCADLELQRSLAENAARVGRNIFDRSLLATRYLDKLKEVCK